MNSIKSSSLYTITLQNQEIVLLDVREEDEYLICKIDKSINIPMSEIVSKKDQLNKADHIVAICHHGIRSAQVCLYLENNGFSNVTNLEGGIDAWAREVDNTMPRY